MARIFGTDGVRGIANVELTPELAFALGRAGAFVLSRYANSGGSISLLVGRDPRLSGDMLEAALSAGILSTGADVYQVGVIPTPGVAYLTAQQPVTAGVMISASHNPAADNGIKFFSHAGFKLADELEDEIEHYLRHPEELPRPGGAQVGRIHRVPDWQSLYLDHLASSVGISLTGLTVVVDCANGAGHQVAPALLRRLGAEVIAINDQPDGLNINVLCGSTHPEELSRYVVKHSADIGLALDGDADRLIAVDHLGQVVDGDAIMAVCALDLQQRGLLAGNKLIATVMSNLGLEQAMQQNGVELLRSKVGDRYVLALMQETGASLGGEQSGHIIFSQYSTTGDGLLTGLQLLQVLKSTGKRLADLTAVVQRYPQILRNVRVNDKGVMSEADVQQAIVQTEQQLVGKGRLLVRPSGTEPVIRVMVEAVSLELAEAAAEPVVQALQRCSPGR